MTSSDPNSLEHVYSHESTPSNTEDLGIALCLVCSPEKSVLDKRDDGKVWYEKLCGIHDRTSLKGDADDEASKHVSAYLSGTGVAVGSEGNARACDVIHRQDHIEPTDNPTHPGGSVYYEE